MNWSRTQTPILSTLLAGCFASLLAFVLDIEKLSELVSIGTLVAFITINACVILVRMREDEYLVQNNVRHTIALFLVLYVAGVAITSISYVVGAPSFLTLLMCTTFFLPFSVVLYLYASHAAPATSPLPDQHFLCPAVPLIPLVGMGVNIYVVCHLSYITVVSYSAWLVLGILLYFAYGYWHSHDAVQVAYSPKQERLETEQTPLLGSIGSNTSSSSAASDVKEN